MKTNLATTDIIVVVSYALALLAIALWISRSDKAHERDTKDYFLASNSLPWWAIGASLIAANISAEQIIGMSGSGFAIGLGIASYEWMAAISLLLVGKYLLPIYLKNKIYTIPQYLQRRFDNKVKTTLAIFWLAVFTFVNLTSVLWLGGLAIQSVAGIDWFYGMLFLAIFSIAYSMYGGLKAVAFTDIIQVVLLILGGLLLSYLALQEISGGEGVLAGFGILSDTVPTHFDMILSEDNPFYGDLPGLSVLIGGLWIMNISYWGFNQYIIQRALAAKSIQEAQKGIAFAAYLKMLMPIIVVLPGIAAVLLYPEISRPDEAYPSMMSLMPVGIKGLVFAALVAAIISSLASMTNSISTIFTMDIYRPFINKDKNEHHYVNVGRITTVIALTIAISVAEPLIGQSQQAFQFIQEFTGFFSPGIVVIFLMGMFWSRMTSWGALVAALGSFSFSLAFKEFWPTLPFMDRIGIVFLMCVAAAVVTSLLTSSNTQDESVSLREVQFKTTTGYNLATLGVVILLIVLYTTWW